MTALVVFDRSRTTGVIAWMAALLLSATAVRAEGSASEKAAAEALFQQATELTQAGDYAAACPKFEASQTLDPALGTLLRLADCYDRVGRTASAWATFTEAATVADRSEQGSRASVARERARDLEGRLSKLSLMVSGDHPSDMGVTINGVEIPAPSWGTPLPVDPGKQRILVRARGYKSWSTEVNLASGPITRVVDVPRLTKVRAEPIRSSASEKSLTVAPIDAAPNQDARAPAGRTLRILGYVIGGLGIAGLGTSGVLAYKASSLDGDSRKECLRGDPNACSPAGKALRDDARAYGNAATVALLAGGALATTGIVFVLAAPARDESGRRQHWGVAMTTRGPGGTLSLEGAW